MSGKEIAAVAASVVWFFTVLGMWIGVSIERAEKSGNPHLKYLLGFWGLCTAGLTIYLVVVY